MRPFFGYLHNFLQRSWFFVEKSIDIHIGVQGLWQSLVDVQVSKPVVLGFLDAVFGGAWEYCPIRSKSNARIERFISVENWGVTSIDSDYISNSVDDRESVHLTYIVHVETALIVFLCILRVR